MKQQLKALLAALALGLPQAAQAQSLSAADIAAMVDERMGAVDEFAELLNDPDPDRSLAAMQIMVGLDDPQIARMALQYGLTSTNPAVRRAALKAYFDTSPNLGVYFDGDTLDIDQFRRQITQPGGSVDTEGEGYLTFKLGAFDETLGCYVYQSWSNLCYVTLTEEAVILTIWRRSVPFRLDENGVLRGEMLVGNLVPAVPAWVPIRQ